jgi:hypothetical protein
MDQNQEDPKSLLADLRNYHVVEAFNPLTEDFTWQVARSVVTADPRYVDQTIKSMNMRNSDHPTMGHVYSKVTIPSGKTYKLPGDVAQVVVKHLVDEIMQREGHKQTLSDPTLRHEIEERIIKNTRDLRSQLSTQTMEDQLAQQLKDLNREEVAQEQSHVEEQPFAQLNGNDDGAASEVPAGATEGNRRSKDPSGQSAKRLRDQKGQS